MIPRKPDLGPWWSYLAEGTYNYAYVDALRTEVLKLQKRDVQWDTLERSVRLWNQINSHVPPPARIQEQWGHMGWVCPFVEGRQASDSEMRGALIDIFNSSGRIVTDAAGPKNFVTTKSGQVICIDIGMALQLEKRESEFYSDKSSRRKSITSLTAWGELVDVYQPFLKQQKEEYPQTVNTVKALLFIKNNRPDILNVDFLKGDLELTNKLAQAYDIQYEHGMVKRKEIVNAIKDIEQAKKVASTPSEVSKGREILSEKRPITIDSIKESCLNELNNYIKSRGSLDKSGIFSPVLLTLLFKNQRLTEIKVRHAKSLMESIEKSNSIKEIRDSITEVLNVPGLERGTFGSGLMTSIGMCQNLISTAVKSKPELEDNNSCSPK
jgi:hypothetical protein